MLKIAFFNGYRILRFFLLILIIGSCSDRDDDIIVSSDNLEAQDFVWKAMNYVYYWQADVIDLADDRFATDEEYQSYLSEKSDIRNWFYNELVYQDGIVDKFSFITNNYPALLNALEGTFTTNGLEFFVSPSEGDNVVIVARYILPNTDADEAGIQRGDVFYAINGTQLTVSNYLELLRSETYTLNMADIVDNTVVPNGISYELTKEEYSENPIYISKIIESGAHKIGYLMYNGFVSGYDLQLNQVFGEFKAAGITDLVLDLRYNGGGSVRSSMYLSGMITGQNEGSIYMQQLWNSKLTDFNGSISFSNSIDGTPLNNLNLEQVYILTSEDTASASELVIHCLKPYIEVVQIGDITTGKNVGSIVVLDYIDEDTINPNHTWGILPITFASSDANGNSDYGNGLDPDFLLEENVSELGVLGEPTEPLLAKAIEEITGAPPTSFNGSLNPGKYNEGKSKVFSSEYIDSSSRRKFINNSMYMMQ